MQFGGVGIADVAWGFVGAMVTVGRVCQSNVVGPR